jgi:hypothetical protein
MAVEHVVGTNLQKEELYKLLTTNDHACLTNLLCEMLPGYTKRLPKTLLQKSVELLDVCVRALAVYKVKCEALQLVASLDGDNEYLSFGECLTITQELFRDQPLVCTLTLIIHAHPTPSYDDTLISTVHDCGTIEPWPSIVLIVTMNNLQARLPVSGTIGHWCCCCAAASPWMTCLPVIV